MEPIIDRRVFFKIAATGVAGYFVSPMKMMAQSSAWSQQPATLMSTAKNVIFVLLPGAPSQLDTFDLHVGAWTPTNFSPTTINGIDWPSGLLPTLASQFSANRFSVIRSCQSSALVHNLLQTWTQIARSPTSSTGKIAPNMGSIVAYEFEAQRTAAQKLPGFLALNGGGSLVGSGYFSGRYSPFDVAPNINGLANLTNPDGEATFSSRYNLLQTADGPLRVKGSPFGTEFEEMADYYSSARTMMYDTAVTNAFRFNATDQTRYGNTGFGNACLTARNVLMSNLGVRYIQLTLGGWDNHQNIYTPNAGIYNPARQLDIGLGNLIADLNDTPGSNGRSMLDETLIIAKGEFGRTVGNITSQAGRDHYFVHSALIAGGGVIGGRVLGKTTASGALVEDPGWSAGRPVYAEDIAATLYSAVGINYTKMLTNDPLGRGFEYIPTTGSYIGQPIVELFR
jgi:uncharacterized protein (DUF1501 family)